MHNEKETIRVVYCEPGKTSRITDCLTSNAPVRTGTACLGPIAPETPVRERRRNN